MSVIRSEPNSTPIKVVCVTEDGYIPTQHEELVDTIYKVCQENGYTCLVRSFDSWTHACDRDEITALPAFHIYVNNIRAVTTFPEDSPFDKLDMCVQTYKEREQRRHEQKKESWIRNIVSYSRFFKVTSQKSISPHASESVEEWGSNPMHD